MQCCLRLRTLVFLKRFWPKTLRAQVRISINIYNCSLKLNLLVIQIDLKLRKNFLLLSLGRKKGDRRKTKDNKGRLFIMISLIPKEKSCTEVDKLHHIPYRRNDSISKLEINKSQLVTWTYKLNIPHNFRNTGKHWDFWSILCTEILMIKKDRKASCTNPRQIL